MEVATDDPLRGVKLRLLASLGAGAGRTTDLARLPSMSACLAAARCLVLRTDEHEAWAPDAEALASCIGARNEAAALALLHAHAETICGADTARREELERLSSEFPARAGAPPVLQQDGPAEGAGRAEVDAASRALQSWAEGRGMQTRLRPAVLPGGLRGLVAGEPLAAGTAILSLPAPLLITYQTAKESDLGKALSRIPGLDGESIAVIWTMVERHDPEAEAAPFWAALPPRFCTGLSAPDSLVDLLSGTLAHRRFLDARAHLRGNHASLRPVFETLLRAYGQHLKEGWFDWDAFAWAAELWYAYAIQVRLPGGDVVPALAPFVSLLNHSPWPHVVRFSEVDAAANCLRLQLLRLVAKGGEEVCLSYGPLPSEDLLLFYGFTVRGNPSDKIELTLDGRDADEAAAGASSAERRKQQPQSQESQRRELVRKALERLGLKAEITLRPGWRRRQMRQLLPAARVLAATELELQGVAPSPARPGGRSNSKKQQRCKQQQKQQQKDTNSWPWQPAQVDGSRNEAEAEALIQAAAQGAQRPYIIALQRVRDELRRSGGAEEAPQQPGGEGSYAAAVPGGTVAAAAAAAAAAASGDGSEASLGCGFDPEERRAFLSHLETLLSGTCELLAESL